jgi:DNA ligase 1
MKRFARLYSEIDSSTSTEDKVAAMVAYFREAPEADAAWAVYFLIGQRLKGSVSTKALWASTLEATGVPEWLLGECVEAVGDFAETVSLLLPEPSAPVQRSLEEWITVSIRPLIEAREDARVRLLGEVWRTLPADERLVFLKVLRGGFRVGVHRKLVVRALAAISGVQAGVIEHRLSGRYAPTPMMYRALLAAGAGEADPIRPYPMYLARQFDEPVDRLAGALGEVRDWQLEWKWDGVRAQLIHRPGALELWSRGDEPMGKAFPELLTAASALPVSCVLDGEVLVWRGPWSAGSVRPFAELQTRLQRKASPAAQLDLFSTDRAVFMAYDVLEVAGEDCRAMPMRERRRRLEALVLDATGDARISSIGLSSVLHASTWAEAAGYRARAREVGAEGLMLKPLDSVYSVGRAAGGSAAGEPARVGATGWWKWKVDPYAVDAVLTHAQPGSGRRAGLYTDYTFALWSGGEADGKAGEGERKLVTFAKAYSGLTQAEIEQVDAWVRGHVRAKRGPVVEVEPRLVFEIEFEGLAWSSRHKSGIAVRFPRMSRWRTDKPAHEADKIERLRALLHSQESA